MSISDFRKKKLLFLFNVFFGKLKQFQATNWKTELSNRTCDRAHKLHVCLYTLYELAKYCIIRGIPFTYHSPAGQLAAGQSTQVHKLSKYCPDKLKLGNAFQIEIVLSQTLKLSIQFACNENASNWAIYQASACKPSCTYFCLAQQSRQHIVLLSKRVLRSAAKVECFSIMSNCQVVNSRAPL